jgi:bifunctional non-homologous end joining protein LigD
VAGVPYISGVPVRLAFIRPLSPSAAVRPPKGDDWLHEPKWDGFRFQVIKDGSEVWLYSHHGAEYTDRLPGMVKVFAKLPTCSAILDGELCLIDPRGGANFYQLMAQMRTSSPDESQLLFLAFDLLHQDGVDLRGIALTERRRDLERLRRKARVPYFSLVETFPDGAVLFDYCNRFGFEGVVSKRRSSRYSSGPSRSWVKVKCPRWKRINAKRWRIFEGPGKPELTEA